MDVLEILLVHKQSEKYSALAKIEIEDGMFLTEHKDKEFTFTGEIKAIQILDMTNYPQTKAEYDCMN